MSGVSFIKNRADRRIATSDVAGLAGAREQIAHIELDGWPHGEIQPQNGVLKISRICTNGTEVGSRNERQKGVVEVSK
jgi:hypothetical protein